MQYRIVRVIEDLDELENSCNIQRSFACCTRLNEFLDSELAALSSGGGGIPCNLYSQEEKVENLLLKNFRRRTRQDLELDRAREAEFAVFVESFAVPVRTWCELRQRQRMDEISDLQTLADCLWS